MIRVTTLFARTAGATAAYYGGYLTKNSHELPGRWTGKQAPDLGLIGEVTPDVSKQSCWVVIRSRGSRSGGNCSTASTRRGT